MDSFNDTFLIDYCNDSFEEFISEISVDLSKKDSKYKKLMKKRADITQEYINVRRILERDECNALTQKEATALRDYIAFADDCITMEQKVIFLKGMREAFYLLKQMDMIKEK